MRRRTVAAASSVIYDERFAFFGLLIVKKECRDRGYGWPITNKRLEYIGVRNAALMALLKCRMQAAYAKNSFKYAHRNFRFHRIGEKNDQAFNNKIKKLFR